jgi:predicted nucleic acid-binding protein
MAGLTLDAGALIAAERGDRRFWAIWKEAERRDVDVTVPATVVAQVFRGARAAVIHRLLKACVVEPLDDARARRAGRLCAASKTSDVVDASVVASAATRGDDVVTGDPTDLRRLAAATHGVGRLIVL